MVQYFKVLDTEAHKILAIKMLRAQFVHNEAAIKRFKLEAKAQVNYHIPDWLTFTTMVSERRAHHIW